MTSGFSWSPNRNGESSFRLRIIVRPFKESESTLSSIGTCSGVQVDPSSLEIISRAGIGVGSRNSRLISIVMSPSRSRSRSSGSGTQKSTLSTPESFGSPSHFFPLLNNTEGVRIGVESRYFLRLLFTELKPFGIDSQKSTAAPTPNPELGSRAMYRFYNSKEIEIP